MKLKTSMIIALISMLVLLVCSPAPSAANITETWPSYYDAVVDDLRGLIYASNPPDDQIHVVSMSTLEVIQSVYTGENSYPATLALSPGGSQLAFSVYGPSVSAVKFLDLDTLMIQPTSLVANGALDPSFPTDILYGKNDLLFTVSGAYSSYDYLHIFNLTMATEIWQSDYLIDADPHVILNEDKTILTVNDSTKYFRFDVTQMPPVKLIESDYGHVNSSRICLRDHKIYSSRGEVWMEDLSQLLHTWSYEAESIECSQLYPYVYYLSEDRVQFVDAETGELQFETGLATDIAFARLGNGDKTLYVFTKAGIKALGAVYPSFELDYIRYMPLGHWNYCPVHYEESFTYHDHGWAVGEDANVFTEVLDGEYCLFAKNPEYIYLFRSAACGHESYQVSTDVRWYGDAGQSYGLVFQLSDDWQNYYLFEVVTDYQAFRVLRRLPDGWDVVIEPATSGSILTGPATNNMSVKVASRDYAYINGHLLGEIPVAGLSEPGKTGVVLIPYSDRPNTEARFDNFRVVELNWDGTPVVGANTEAGSLSADVHPLPANFDWPLPPLDLLEQH